MWYQNYLVKYLTIKEELFVQLKNEKVFIIYIRFLIYKFK